MREFFLSFLKERGRPRRTVAASLSSSSSASAVNVLIGGQLLAPQLSAKCTRGSGTDPDRFDATPSTAPGPRETTNAILGSPLPNTGNTWYGAGLFPRIRPCSMSLKLYRCPPTLTFTSSKKVYRPAFVRAAPCRSDPTIDPADAKTFGKPTYSYK